MSKHQQDFHYEMPDDEEDDEEHEGQDEEYDDEEVMHEDELAIPIDQADNHMSNQHQGKIDSNRINQPVASSNHMIAMQENAYQIASMQGHNSTMPQQQQFGKQIQNQIPQKMHPGYNPQGSQLRMRPQSAKTVPQVQANAFGPTGTMNMYNEQPPGQQWMQQPAIAPGYSQQVLPSGLIYNPPVMPNNQSLNKNVVTKRRPGTAGKKAHVNFGKKLGQMHQIALQPPVLPQMNLSSKATSQVNLEVYKMRPRIIKQERERLYDDVMKQKMATNNLASENIRLKTRIQIVEGELNRKDKVIDDLITQQENSYGLPVQSKYSGRTQMHLVMKLKRKIRDLHAESAKRNEEIEALRRNIRSTRQQEIEVEIKLYIEECARLRQQLEEVIKTKDTFADPQELKIIEEKFQQRDQIIQSIQQQNDQLSQQLILKGQENMHMSDLLQKLESKLKKAQASSKTNSKFKRDAKDLDREAHKMRKELIDLKHKNQSLERQIKESKSPAAQRPTAMRMQSANPRMSVHAEEARRLTFENHRLQSQNEELIHSVQQLQMFLKQKDEELAMTISDKMRFKELSESYMQEVARLESQLGAGGVKPKNKLSQRPKDTVMRDQSNSLSNMSVQRMKNVDPRQLQLTVLQLKLLLQRQKLVCQDIKSMEMLLFGEDTNLEEDFTIAELRQVFENLNLPQKKALLVARYLAETPAKSDFIFNENLSIKLQDALENLQKLIGEYSLFSPEGSEFDDDPNCIQEEYVQKLMLENFRDSREQLMEALRCEDYQEQGILDLDQLVEAISAVKEDVDANVLNYMVYFVLLRSANFDNLQYKHLIELLDQLIQSQSRKQSTTRKNRPESSSPDKLKLRNQKSSNPVPEKAPDNEDYSVEEIADDPDEGDSQAELIKQQAQVPQMVAQDPPEVAKTNSKEEDEKAKEEEEEDEDYEEDQKEFEDSPRQKPGVQDKVEEKPQDDAEKKNDDEEDADRYEDDDDEEVDEDEVIDVAERIFIRIAEQIINQEIRSVRDVFADQIIETEIEDQVIELLMPQGLLTGIKRIGIDDLTPKEVKYLLRVLTKPEIDSAIVFQELLQIMENLGLYDEDEYGEDYNDRDDEDSSPELDGEEGDAEGPDNEKKKKKREALDLSKLDEKSVKIMVMLMVNLLQLNMTTQEFFEDFIFEQKVKTKTKQFSMIFIKSEDFFRILQERSIRKKNNEHENLRKFLQLNDDNPSLLLLKNIRKTLELMSQNEAFMEAIQEDVLANEAPDDEEKGDPDDYEALPDEDQTSDNGRGSHGLQTVQEGNETNQMTTGEKGMFMNSNTSAKPISKVSKTDMSAEEININPQPDKNKDEEEEKYDDDFDGQDDYEF